MSSFTVTKANILTGTVIVIVTVNAIVTAVHSTCNLLLHFVITYMDDMPVVSKQNYL
jgi:hypothetical protein